MSSYLNSICRTCLSDSNNYHQLFDYVEENYEIIEMLDSVVPQIDIRTTSKFPTLVCQSCVDKLLTGYKFQQLCIETNYRLHGLLGNAYIETESEKILNPWTGCLSIKLEDEDAGYECEIPIEFTAKMGSRRDNDRMGDAGGESETSSSNENLLALNGNKLPIKIENIKIEDPEVEQFTKHEAKENKHINLDDTCMPEVEKPNRKGKHSCEKCGKTFNGIYVLKRHSSLHSPTRPFECKICKYRFDKPNILKIHLSRHKNETADNSNTQSRREFFKCPFCPRRFEKQASFSAHLHKHKHNSSAANYLCKVCQRSFMSAKTLTEHMTKQHPEVEKHKCNQCNKTFCNTSSLRRHIKKHALKKYQCPKCPSRFNFREHMYAHMHTHNLEKTHPCPQCDRRLSSATSLRRHMKKHTGLEMYPCLKCSSSFSHSSELKKHSSIHFNAK